MTPQQADRLIKRGKAVRFYNTRFKESFVGVPVSRDRYTIRIQHSDGHIGVFERSDLDEVMARVMPDGTLINPV